MSMGPLGGVVGSAAGTSLSQTAGARPNVRKGIRPRSIGRLLGTSGPRSRPASDRRNRTRRVRSAMPTAAGYGKGRPSAGRTGRRTKRRR